MEWIIKGLALFLGYYIAMKVGYIRGRMEHDIDNKIHNIMGDSRRELLYTLCTNLYAEIIILHNKILSYDSTYNILSEEEHKEHKRLIKACESCIDDLEEMHRKDNDEQKEVE